MTARILVIEDDPVIRTEVLDWLEFEGYAAEGVQDGTAGVQAALRQTPDLVISDINMPEMNGHRVLIELRSHPPTASVPFIFLTARTTRSDVRYGMELGAEDYITKPFSHEELLGAVKAQLAKAEVRREQARQQMDELRSALTRTLPHELRTPLVGIIGYGDLLMMDADHLSPDEIREMAALIVDSGQRLHRLIENYLLYAQLAVRAFESDDGAARLMGQLEQPNSTVANACEKVARSYERAADLKLDLQGNCSVRIDRMDLDKVVAELADNAFKFSPPQTPVSVSTQARGDTFQISIVDRGRGMRPEEISRISAFTQFERAVYEQQGSGLGLIIAKRLVEMYGGSLEIDTRPQGGTSVTVKLLKDGS